MFRLKKLFTLSFIGAALTQSAFANPVSFKDGWGVMPTFTPDWSDVQFNYSITNRYAVGLSTFYRKGSDHTATYEIGQFNYLIKRWNQRESQANIFASIGVGGRNAKKEDYSLAGYGALEADYETRRIYTLIAAERLQSGGGVDFTRLRYRFGVAPYKAPIDQLQTWIIGQVDYMPEMEDQVTVTPILRFFYNNLALEVGSSLQGKPQLGIMVHF